MKMGMSWLEATLLRGPAEDRPSLKIETRCKQCGQLFVKYAYERVARCESCRKGGEMAAASLLDVGEA